MDEQQADTAQASALPRARRNWRPFAVGAAVGLALAGIVWGVTSMIGPRATSSRPATTSAAPATFTMRGTLELYAGSYGGYEDISQGTQVTVYDDAGRVVALGRLGKDQGSSPVTYPITVEGVAKGPNFYQVEVAHRGKVTVTPANAEAGKVALSLGT